MGIEEEALPNISTVHTKLHTKTSTVHMKNHIKAHLLWQQQGVAHQQRTW